MRRCFSPRYKEKYTWYKDVTCCEEWLLFSNFKSWMEQQDWEGKVLDKDLLYTHNKIYSPTNCLFVVEGINNFLLKSESARGECPLGVTRPEKGLKFRSNCRVGGGTRLGEGFYTAEEAHRYWQENKIGHGLNLAESEESVIVKEALLVRVNTILDDYISGRETKYF